MGWNATPQLLYPQKRYPVPIIQETMWLQGRFGRVRIFRPTEFRAPASQARIESLHRLGYLEQGNENKYCHHIYRD